MSGEANKIKWIVKEHTNFRYIWNFEPNIANSLGEILFEKLENLQRMYELINVFATQQFRSFVVPLFLIRSAEDCKNCSN